MEKVYLIIPAYNEELVLPIIIPKLISILESLIQKQMISNLSKIIFINDGSTDKSWEKIQEFNKNNDKICGINLSKNFGHQNALLAGLMFAKDYADITISMDADLQDDINKLEDFIISYKKGNEIVFGVRKDRKSDSWFKKNTALFYYKLLDKLGLHVVFNHADYRLMSKKSLIALSQYKETNLFLRGLICTLGFKVDYVYYDRNERAAGVTKYPFKKMLKLAIHGVFSFSVTPIKIIIYVGIFSSLIGLIILMYSMYNYFQGTTVRGWTFLTVSIWILGGIQILSLGIIGEYISRIYQEIKNRPRFIIDKIIFKNEN